MSAVAFSPDGKVLVSGSADSTVRLWDAQSGKQIRSFEGHADAVFAVAFSPDGKVLVSGSADSTVRLWDTQSGRFATLSGYHDGVTSVAFGRDVTVIALAGGQTEVTLVQWKERIPSAPPSRIGPADIVAFSPDGKTLATVSAHMTVRLWTVTLPTP